MSSRLTRHGSRTHVIEDVKFQLMADFGMPMEAAPITCSCGAITTSGEWERHRGASMDQERWMRNHPTAQHPWHER